MGICLSMPWSHVILFPVEVFEVFADQWMHYLLILHQFDVLLNDIGQLGYKPVTGVDENCVIRQLSPVLSTLVHLLDPDIGCLCSEIPSDDHSLVPVNFMSHHMTNPIFHMWRSISRLSR